MRDIHCSILAQCGRLGAAALLLIFIAGASSACGGCGSEGASDDSTTKEKKASEDPQKSDDEASSMTQRREVFGLPLPPSVVSIEEKGPRVHVKSAMTVEEVGAFFKTRLTDYELLEPRHQIRFVGLRDYMPEIYAYGSGNYTFVVYRPAAAPKEQADKSAGGDDRANPDRGKQASTGTGATASRKPINQRRNGEQVLDRTSDGKLLAPGARWGVPYTPPPGSPLDQKRLRSNFGRPFGEWMLQ